jgi:hypothetical protein
MNPLAEVHAELHGETAVGRVQGEVDASNAELVAARLRELLVNRSHGLVVGPATPIARMLAVTGLDRSYPTHANVAAALA